MTITKQSKSHKFNWKSELIQAVLILILGGTFQELILEGGFRDIRNIELIDVFNNGLFWVLLWKGSEFQVIFLDYLGLKWEVRPVTRSAIALLLTIGYVYLVVTCIFLFQHVYFGGMSFDDLMSKLSFRNYFPALVMTIAIMAIMHGRGFLLEWRKATIEKEQYKNDSLNFKYEALKNQVNPHFLFNSLNVLSSLVYENQDKAVEFISKLSNVYRYVLDSKNEELVDVSRELGFIKSFIFLQQIRFDESLIVNVIGTSNGFVPPLALQVLLENAIKHNIVSASKPLTIDLKLSDHEILVSNNIQEKLSKDSTGIGLDNLKARFDFLTERKVTIENDGKTFTVTVPVLKVNK
ncbi:MAG: sensor histidine kinase YesM [Flavobacteriaceae bacterium]|jgi:sensor histidine kinase YesM